jgi:short-subunit dehydrogenase
VDTLINVAGTALYGSLEEIPMAEARRLFEINLFGAAPPVQELAPFGVDVVIVRPEAIKTDWRAIAGATFLANSGEGPYAKATRAMHAKYMSARFDKMVANPNVVADVIERILSAKRPKSVCMARLWRTSFSG